MLKTLLFTGVNAIGVPAVLRRVNRSRIAILMYHGFSARTGDSLPDFEGLHQRIDHFRNHLRFLARHYSVVSLDTVAAAFRGEASLPDRPAVISVDDGYQSVATLAFPVLEELGLPAAVFLCTDFLDGQPLWNDRIEHSITHSEADRLEIEIAGRSWTLDLDTPGHRRRAALVLTAAIKRVAHESRDSYVAALEQATGARLSFDGSASPEILPMTWEQARMLAESGLISIGSHSKSHAILSRCAPETLHFELAQSKQRIEEQIGLPCTLFCYPNGGIGDFDDRTRRALVEAGFRCALTSVPGLNDSTSDVLALRRLYRPASVAALAVHMSGLRDLLRS